MELKILKMDLFLLSLIANLRLKYLWLQEETAFEHTDQKLKKDCTTLLFST